MSANSKPNSQRPQGQLARCPFLGIAKDPATSASEPIQEHRCYAGEHPKKIDLAYQSEYCLADRYPTCIRYKNSPRTLEDRPPVELGADDGERSRSIESRAVRSDVEQETVQQQEKPSNKSNRLTPVILTVLAVGLLLIAFIVLKQPRTPSSPDVTSRANETNTAIPSFIAGKATSSAAMGQANPTVVATINSPTSPTMVMGSTPAGLALLAQVAQAEKNLRTGQFKATIQYGSGNQASNQVQFDMGDASHPPRLHVITTYQGSQDQQTSERIVIGNQAWQRQGNGPWSKINDTEGAWEQVQTFLPHADTVSQADMNSGGAAIDELRWHDPGRNLNITLKVDPTTGVPQEMDQAMQATNSVLMVVYSGWNTPVDINPPQ